MYSRKDLINATINEKDEILKFYHSFIGQDGCAWTLDYPCEVEFLRDIEYHCLYYIKDRHGIVATISIDHDEQVDRLEIWTIKNAVELARVAVRKDMQNKGIARIMINALIEIIKEQGYEGVHLLVSQNNKPALESYKKLGFDNLGELNMYGEAWFCYEKSI